MRMPGILSVSLLVVGLFLFASCATYTPPSPSSAAVSAQDTSLITGISTTASSSSHVITIQATTPLRYTAFQLADPLRLVLDFVDTTFASSVQPLTVQDGVIQSITPSLLENERIARVEIDLQQEATHRITQQSGGLTISLTLPSALQSASPREPEQELRIKDFSPQQLIESPQPPVQPLQKPDKPSEVITIGHLPPPRPDKAHTLEGLQVEEKKEFIEVRLFADGKVGAYNVLKQNASLQLLVNLPEMQTRLLQRDISIQNSLLENIQVKKGDSEEPLAVVFRFRESAAYKIHREENQLVFRFSTPPAPAAPFSPAEVSTMSTFFPDSTSPAPPVEQRDAVSQPPVPPLSTVPPSPIEVATISPESFSAQQTEPLIAQQKSPYQIRDISVQKLANKSLVRIETTSPTPRYAIFLREDPLRLALELENMMLPASQQRIIDIDPAKGGAIQSILPLQDVQADPPAVEIIVRLQEKVPYRVLRAENGLVLEVSDPPVRRRVSEEKKPAEEQTPKEKSTEALEQPQYTGTRISLDFQRADINDILRLLAEVSGLNIITGGDVQGEVSIRMVNVPWDQALDVILRANGLGQERIGNVIRVAPRDRLFREQQEEAQNKQARLIAEEPVTEIIPIKYAVAKDLQPNLQSLLSQRGTINVDERTNTLIIRDIQDNIREISGLIQTLDQQTPQVLIEARIVETTREFERELGIQWGGLLSSTTDFRFPHTIGITGGRGAISTGALPPPPGPPAATAPTTEDETGTFVVNLPAAVGQGAGGALGIVLGHVNNSALLAIQISALEDNGQARIISNPRVVTLDNQEAKIDSGFTIPFETTSAEGTRTEFVDATINLTVTPHVTPDNFVIMQIRAARNQPDFSNRSAGGAPTIIRREATTNVLVRDGETTVIGGLFQQDLTNALSGVPFLSKIPVLGWLFKNELRRDRKDELLIFITPRIIRQRVVTGAVPQL